MPPPLPPAIELAARAGDGGRCAAVAQALETALVQALTQARPQDVARLNALNIEAAALIEAGAPVRVRAWVQRATRTLAFVSGDVFAEDGARLASGAGVFELTPGA